MPKNVDPKIFSLDQGTPAEVFESFDPSFSLPNHLLIMMDDNLYEYGQQTQNKTVARDNQLFNSQ